MAASTALRRRCLKFSDDARCARGIKRFRKIFFHELKNGIQLLRQLLGRANHVLVRLLYEGLEKCFVSGISKETAKLALTLDLRNPASAFAQLNALEEKRQAKLEEELRKIGEEFKVRTAANDMRRKMTGKGVTFEDTDRYERDWARCVRMVWLWHLDRTILVRRHGGWKDDCQRVRANRSRGKAVRPRSTPQICARARDRGYAPRFRSDPSSKAGHYFRAIGSERDVLDVWRRSRCGAVPRHSRSLASVLQPLSHLTVMA